MSSPFSASQLAAFEEALRRELARLSEELEAHRTHHTDGGVHIRTHRDETDDDAVVEEMNRSEIDAVQRTSEALAEVQAALARLAAGTYGLCEACGAEIAPARLHAAPAARLCIDCAREQESHGRAAVR